MSRPGPPVAPTSAGAGTLPIRGNNLRVYGPTRRPCPATSSPRAWLKTWPMIPSPRRRYAHPLTSGTIRRRHTSSSRRRHPLPLGSQFIAATTHRRTASMALATGTGGCGMNSVNVIGDSFGHGVFDGYSIVTGHEYAEAVTDPDNFASVQDGWNDAQGSENGDKCAWTGLANVPMDNRTSFAVQPLWSNKAFDVTGQGCVRSAPSNPHAMPAVGITPPAIIS